MIIGKRSANVLDGAKHLATSWGTYGRKLKHRRREFRVISAERNEYEKQRTESSSPDDFLIMKSYTFFEDRFNSAGQATGHYFHQDLFVAREIYKRQPTRHVDVGSSVYGFVSHVASFRPIDVIDIRLLENTTEGISFIQYDLMQSNPTLNNSTDSLSCLHALEHFGLGRYNDPIDYLGWRKGLDSLTAMLQPGGVLYLSVPTGSVQRVEFNAHRVFSLPFLRDILLNDYEIENLAFVHDDGSMKVGLNPFSDEANASFDADYGCSIWVLRLLS
jgi:hypothetical protein